VARDGEEPGVAVVEPRLEHLHALAGDDRAPDPPHELLALAAEHHAGDDLDPAAGDLEAARHSSSVLVRRPGTRFARWRRSARSAKSSRGGRSASRRWRAA
jgi:hypothetical protein